MPIQVISDPNASRSAGLGTAVGSSLGGLLQGLANMQLQEYSDRKKSQKIAQGLSSLGVPEKVSSQVSNLPLKLQEMFLKQFFGSEAFGSKQEGGFEQGMPSQEQGYEQEQQMQPIPQISPQERLLLESMQDPTGQQSMGQGTGSLLSQLSPETQGLLEQAQMQQGFDSQPQVPQVGQAQLGQAQQGFGPQEQQGFGPQIDPAQAPQVQRPAVRRPVAPKYMSRQGRAAANLQAKPTRQKSFQEMLITPRPTAADRNRAEEMLLKREKLAESKQKEIDSSTKAFHDETMKKAELARENDLLLNRMGPLLKKGNLTAPAVKSLINTVAKGLWGVGYDFSGFQTVDSQEFDKLSASFVKGAKAIFGPRMTQREVEFFMKTIPTLEQTPKARARLVRGMKIANEAAKVRKRAMDEIIMMNDGERPKNLELIVERKIATKLDSLKDAFVKDAKKLIPKKAKASSERLVKDVGGMFKRVATSMLG